MELSEIKIDRFCSVRLLPRPIDGVRRENDTGKTTVLEVIKLVLTLCRRWMFRF